MSERLQEATGDRPCSGNHEMHTESRNPWP
jgi:hypothetical protein